MLERSVEYRLKDRLESRGFKVLKMVTLGTMGAPDRLILRPKWSPGPPWLVEIKRPGKKERRLQAAIRFEWRERGLLVLHAVSTYDEVDALVDYVTNICNAESIDGIT